MNPALETVDSGVTEHHRPEVFAKKSESSRVIGPCVQMGERHRHSLLGFTVLSAFRHRASSGSHRGDRRVPLPVSKAVCGRFCLCRPRHPARNPVSNLQHLQRQRPVSRPLITLSFPTNIFCYVLPRTACWFGLNCENGCCFYLNIMRIDGGIQGPVRV